MSGCSKHIVVQRAVEGTLDEAVSSVLLAEVGVTPGDAYGSRGKDFLRRGIAGFNAAAEHAPWFVLVDLDDETCAPATVTEWVGLPAEFMCLRFAVREVETWLFADRSRLASFLRVPVQRIPQDPEQVEHPKELMVHLARRSNSRTIVEDLVPPSGSGRIEGPAYAVRLIEFVRESWRPREASRLSESLSRTLRCLEKLCGRATTALGLAG